jgi:hypothetical protein
MWLNQAELGKIQTIQSYCKDLKIIGCGLNSMRKENQKVYTINSSQNIVNSFRNSKISKKMQLPKSQRGKIWLKLQPKMKEIYKKLAQESLTFTSKILILMFLITSIATMTTN